MRRGLPKLGDILLTTEAPLGHAAMVDREDVALAQRIIRFRMDVVTGKLDVRGIDLPAADDIDVPEECSDLLDSESVIEEEELQEIPAEVD